jgi:hypothetical protein
MSVNNWKALSAWQAASLPRLMRSENSDWSAMDRLWCLLSLSGNQSLIAHLQLSSDFSRLWLQREHLEAVATQVDIWNQPVLLASIAQGLVIQLRMQCAGLTVAQEGHDRWHAAAVGTLLLQQMLRKDEKKFLLSCWQSVAMSSPSCHPLPQAKNNQQNNCNSNDSLTNIQDTERFVTLSVLCSILENLGDSALIAFSTELFVCLLSPECVERADPVFITRYVLHCHFCSLSDFSLCKQRPFSEFCRAC